MLDDSGAASALAFGADGTKLAVITTQSLVRSTVELTAAGATDPVVAIVIERGAVFAAVNVTVGVADHPVIALTS